MEAREDVVREWLLPLVGAYSGGVLNLVGKGRRKDGEILQRRKN